jgi:hypothetical protein
MPRKSTNKITVVKSSYAPLSVPNLIRVISLETGVLDVDERDIESIRARHDPNLRSFPIIDQDPNRLALTADDCVWLWAQGIGTGEAND